MSKNTKTNLALPDFNLSPEVQAQPIIGIQHFFNGESVQKIRLDLDKLKETTITESYGELDKDDKWLLVDFLRRIGNLIEVAHLLNYNHTTPKA
ncbi:hypothetical protein [Pseudoflavitalea rhizosphaerae]|uniref:hypothetical protein n=1 Tax=Pseudoflavitalea rhizosphaerae TaxID=1884793 RepID=UPI000F8C668A|nr:hypothetical protein [Pseudoflavitalea rhizosphaerae]